MNFEEHVTRWFNDSYDFMLSQFYCQIHLTRACEHSCAHCYFVEIPDSHKEELSYSEVKLLIDKTKDAAVKRHLNPIVDFTGGDPLLHADFFAMAEYATSQGVPFGMKGNPDLLRGPALNHLRRLNVRAISLSLEGLEPVHDRIRGKGSFNETVETIGRLKNEGFTVRVHSTISKFNSTQLLPLLDFFTANHFVIDNWTWSRFWSATDPTDMLSKTQLSSIFQQLVDTYESKFSDPTFYVRNQNGQQVPRIYVGFKEHLWYPYLFQSGYIDEQTRGKIESLPNSINCTATKHVYIVDPDGKVYKCRKIVASSIGNILTQSFDEMLRGEIAQSFLRMNDHSACGSCQFFNGCGGCAAIALAKRRSIWAGDPDCFIYGAPSASLGEFGSPETVK